MDESDIIDNGTREAMTHLKDMPPWRQNINLLLACKMDTTGHLENIARILAKYGVEPEEVMPCIIEMMLEIANKS